MLVSSDNERDYLARALGGRRHRFVTISDGDLRFGRTQLVLSCALLDQPLHLLAFLSTLTFLLTLCPGRVCSIDCNVIRMIF